MRLKNATKKLKRLWIESSKSVLNNRLNAWKRPNKNRKRYKMLQNRKILRLRPRETKYWKNRRKRIKDCAKKTCSKNSNCKWPNYQSRIRMKFKCKRKCKYKSKRKRRSRNFKSKIKKKFSKLWTGKKDIFWRSMFKRSWTKRFAREHWNIIKDAWIKKTWNDKLKLKKPSVKLKWKLKP